MTRPAHDLSTFDAEAVNRRLLVKHVVQNTLIAWHEVFRIAKTARHCPLHPGCEVIPCEHTGGSEPLTGVEHESRWSGVLIDLTYLLPVVIEALRVSLGLLFIIYKEGRREFVPYVRNLSGEHCV